MCIRDRRKVAILGGSFDPVHSGHLMLASYVAQFCGPDEVWLSLSPANPFKVGKKMGDDEDRRRTVSYTHLVKMYAWHSV